MTKTEIYKELGKVRRIIKKSSSDEGIKMITLIIAGNQIHTNISGITYGEAVAAIEYVKYRLLAQQEDKI